MDNSKNTIYSMKKYFNLKEDRSEFQSLTPEERAIVKRGHEIAKKFQATKGRTKNNEKLKGLFSDETVDNYQEENRKFLEVFVKHCVKATGADIKNFKMEDIKNPMIHSKIAFRETFNAIIAQVMTPLVPALVSTTFMEMADIANVGWGDSARFQVRSNDTFYVTRMAEGVLTGTTQRIYDDELTLTASPYGIKTTINWYQVAAGTFDFGLFVDKVAVSFANYINLMVIQAITADITTNIAASSPYFTNGFTTAKWSTLVDKLSSANGNAKITAFGSLSALSAIIPSQVGLQQGLGEEWTSTGFLYDYFGVNLVKVPQILLPNTVNTTALFGVPNDTIWLFAEGGYKPVKLLFEGTAITKDFVPTETADKEMGIEIVMKIGQTFVAASKYGAITGVSLGA